MFPDLKSLLDVLHNPKNCVDCGKVIYSKKETRCKKCRKKQEKKKRS